MLKKSFHDFLGYAKRKRGFCPAPFFDHARDRKISAHPRVKSQAAENRFFQQPVKLLAAAVVLFAVSAVAAAATEPVTAIRAAAVRFVRNHASAMGGRVTVRAAGPDSRLRLARCGQPLKVFLPAGGRIDSRTTVGVRCAGPKPWKLYVPVVVSRYAKVLVAARGFRRGETPNAADLKRASRNLDQLPYGWFSDAGALAGRHFVRGVRAGEVLTPAMLAVSDVVHRGQRVVLLARSAGIQVRMAGRALAGGAPDERIRVENLSSHRVVEGMVRSSGIVEVLP